MSIQPFSFAADRRSGQTFYHFSERVSGDTDRRGFSQQDSLIWALGKIYQSKFDQIPIDFRNSLVDTLVSYVSLPHHNLLMLAAANYVLYFMRVGNGFLNINPDYFASPQCESPSDQCISNSPSIISCKQQINSMLDPSYKDMFDYYYNNMETYLMADMTTKKPEEMPQARALYKITFLRYIIFIQNSLQNAMNQTVVL